LEQSYVLLTYTHIYTKACYIECKNQVLHIDLAFDEIRVILIYSTTSYLYLNCTMKKTIAQNEHIQLGYSWNVKIILDIVGYGLLNFWLSTNTR